MARLSLTLISVLLPFAAIAQSDMDRRIKEAGTCGRCHIASVLEWAISGHPKAGAGCIACHGVSSGHVTDERNNVKPDKVPHAAAIAGLCASCHGAGCPKSANRQNCQSCHHVHALIDAKKAAGGKDEHLEKLLALGREFDRQMAEGEKLVRLEQWSKAQAAFRAALAVFPGNWRAAERAELCQRRLRPGLAGFEALGTTVDSESGLPRDVTVSGTDIRMVLVPAGDVQIGSEKLAASRPVHEVHVAPFYLARFEVTQAQWKALMGNNPSAFQGARYPGSDRMPVERITWEDAQAFIAKLNQKAAGGGFRLPTEAEWEYAARADAAASEDLSAVAVFDRPVLEFAPLPAGSRKPNKLGLSDMQGNVWEWCSSLASPYPYAGGDGRENASEPGLRVLRGGSYADTPDLLDPAFRHFARPTDRMPWNGMRLARSVPR